MSVIPSTPAQPSRLKKLFAPPVFADEEKTRIASLANTFLWTVLVVMVVATLIVSPLIPRPIIMIMTGVVICLPLIVALSLVRRGAVRAASIIIVATLWLILVVLGIYSGGVINGGFAALILVVLIAGILLGGKAAVFVAGISMVSATIAYALEITGHLPPPLGPISPVNYWVTHLVNYVVAGLLIYLTMDNLTTALKRARRNEQSLTQSNDELQIIRESLEQRVAQRTAQLEASAAVGQAAAAILDVDQLLREVVNLITARFGFYYAAVFTLEPTGKFAVLREATGEAGRLLKERGHQLEVDGQSMVGTALSQRKSQIARDVDVEAIHFANPLLPETRSEIALPLISGDRLLGALDVQSTQDAAFDESNAAVLQSMSNQIAVALNNALAFQQAERQVQQQVQLNELARTLLNSASLTDLYYNLATSLSGVLEYDYLSLTLVHGDNQSLHEYRLNASANPVITEGPLRSRNNSLSGRTVERRKLLMSRTFELDQAILEDLADWQQAGFQLAMSLPLLVGNRTLGTLNVASRKPDAFLMSNSRQYEQIANQVAVALENARLAETQQRTLHDMEALARQLTGQAWEKQMQRLPDQTRNKQYLRSGVPVSLPAVLPEAERALELQQPVVWMQAAEPTASTQPQATLTAPITLRGEVLGALQVGETSQARKWSEEDMLFIQAVADQVALAMDNARLIEDSERRAAREARLNQIAQQLRQTTDVNSILQTAAEQLSLALDTSHAQAQVGQQADREKVQR